MDEFDVGYDVDLDYAAWADAELNNFEYCDASDPDILSADSIW